jgi:hypothetical protein
VAAVSYLPPHRPAAAWIEPLLLGHWSADLAMLPGGFEAYARIFFPFEGEDGAQRHERVAAVLTEPETTS